MKVYSMSDIHGYLKEFEKSLSYVDLSGDNKLVLLGDYIHGPDSCGVLDKIIKLQQEYGCGKVIALCGNHEEMALGGEWPICEDRFGFLEQNCSEEKERFYLQWMESLREYYEIGNAIFVHAGIDEELAAAGFWEYGVDKRVFTRKFPAETGKIQNFDKKIVAGHVGTDAISGTPDFHDIFFDGGSHYYINGTVQISGKIPVLMYDTERDRFFQIDDFGAHIIESGV